VDDGQQVLGQVGLGGGPVRTHSLAVNHEACSVSHDEPFDKVESETREAVSVGNHKLLEISSQRGVQNLEKASSPEVDSAGDVGDEAVPWVLFSEGVDLPPEVGALGRGGDSAVRGRPKP
jgi:hypothetical protein